MTYQTLLYEKKDGIGVVTLNRPDKLNALNSTVYKELYDVFVSIEDDPEVRVVILTGSGDRAFAAGSDVAEMQNMNTLEIQKFMGVTISPNPPLPRYTAIPWAAVVNFPCAAICVSVPKKRSSGSRKSTWGLSPGPAAPSVSRALSGRPKPRK